ncbi:MAG: hypothetical protein ACRD2E_10265 [Terriglobales bacterium]
MSELTESVRIQARWLSAEPAGAAAANPANPQAWKLGRRGRVPHGVYPADGVAHQPLRFTDPLGLSDPPDPSALCAGSQGYVLEATGGFKGGENEFQLRAIPVRNFGRKPGPVFYFTGASSNFLGTVNEAVGFYWSTDHSIIGTGAMLFGGPGPGRRQVPPAVPQPGTV